MGIIGGRGVGGDVHVGGEGGIEGYPSLILRGDIKMKVIYTATYIHG